MAHDLTCVPVVRDDTDEYGTRTTVWFTFPNAGVDRPETYGVSTGDAGKRVTQALTRRLCAAAKAGAVVQRPTVKTDQAGQTYVSFSCPVLGRRLNADLRALGF